MGVLATDDTDTVIGYVLAGRPEVRDELRRVHDLAWTATDPTLLEVCRLRIAQLLGCAFESTVRNPVAQAAGFDERKAAMLTQWPSSPVFDARDRAALAYTEQYVIDVASLDDVTVTALRDELGEDGLANFVNALLVVEQRMRLRLMWERLELTDTMAATKETENR